LKEFSLPVITHVPAGPDTSLANPFRQDREPFGPDETKPRPPRRYEHLTPEAQAADPTLRQHAKSELVYAKSDPRPDRSLPLQLTHRYGKLWLELQEVDQALADRVEKARAARVDDQVKAARETFLALPELAAVREAEDRLRISEDTLAVGQQSLAKIREQLGDPELPEDEIAKLLKRQGELTLKTQAMEIRVGALKEQLAGKRIDFEAAFYAKKQSMAAAYREQARKQELAALAALKAALFQLAELESALVASRPDDPYHGNSIPSVDEILSA
jgi:hypothetical protein